MTLGKLVKVSKYCFYDFLNGANGSTNPTAVLCEIKEIIDKTYLLCLGAQEMIVVSINKKPCY